MKKILIIFSIFTFLISACTTIIPLRTNTYSPNLTNFFTITPSPSSTPAPTITPTEDPKPEFPEDGTMRSEHLTASVSQRWMDLAGIEKVTLDPEILEQVYKVMLVHWAASLASINNDIAVKSFTDHYLCDSRYRWPLGFDFSIDLPKAHLTNVLDAYEHNLQTNNSFNYSFDFDQGVSGTVESIEIKALATQQEFDYIEKLLRDQGMNYIFIYGGDNLRGTRKEDDIAIFYFNPSNVLHVYTWDGNPYHKKYLDISADRSYALFSDLFFYTQVNGGVSIIRTKQRRFIPQCAGYSMHEALGCVDYFCNQSGKTPSNFVITLSNGETIAPLIKNNEMLIMTPTPRVIQASNIPIDIYDSSIYFSNVEIVDVGTNPKGSGSSLALSIIFTEVNGDYQLLREFSQLPIWFTDDTGQKFEDVFVQNLEPQNGSSYFQWIVYVTNPSKKYYMHAIFPSGEEIVEFSPLIP